MSHRRFFWLWAVVFVLVTSSAVLANLLIDPYALFGAPRIAGINDLKPMAGTRVTIVKPYQLVRASPKTVVGGNSRPELGIDPAHDCWGRDHRPVYNAGVPGADLYTQARLLQAAIAQGGVQRIAWGLDFRDFLSSARRTDWPGEANETDARLPVTAAGEPNGGYRWQWLTDARDALLSLGAFSDSWVTLLSQAASNVTTRRADGFNPARDYRDIIDHEGQFVLFQQKNREIVRTFARPGLTLYPPSEDWSFNFESVRFLLAIAATAEVDVMLFINPYHADYLAAIDVAGKWAMFNRWKRRLVQLAEAEGVAALWDFSAFDAYSTAPPPGSGVTGEALAWFWEPAHYRKELGDLMIERMTDGVCVRAGADFGVRLSSATVDDQLRSLDAGKRRYFQDFPKRVNALREMLSETVP